MFSPASAVVPQVKAGKLKVLASATAKRAGILPDVPTMAEAGMPDFDTSIWFGLMAPAGTPQRAIDKLARDAARGGASRAEVVSGWRPQGSIRSAAAPEDFARYIDERAQALGRRRGRGRAEEIAGRPHSTLMLAALATLVLVSISLRTWASNCAEVSGNGSAPRFLSLSRTFGASSAFLISA